MVKIFALVLIAELWMTAGHICFKKSANNFNLKTLFRSPVLWVGIMTMVVGLFFWLEALGSGELNVVYLLGSIQYILVLFATPVFLKERIDAPKLIGTLLVSLGIILITIS